MAIFEVNDAGDARVEDFRNLTDVAWRRVQEPAAGLYIAESEKVITRAVAAGHLPRSFLVQQKWLDSVVPLAGDAPIYLVPDEVMEQVTGYHVHRGALAAMQRPALAEVGDLIRDARTVVVLEDIVDHTNVGAVFRSVAAIGADAVLVTPRCADPLYRRSVRVSMGTVFQVPWTRTHSWARTREALHDAGFHIAALALDERAQDLDAFAATRAERVALVLGAEGDGLSRRALEAADSTVMIPMVGGVDSLNVAAAAAVALWALRVRV